ncbi:MAG TPA: hypothetical protein VGJ81_05415 [Thermoanaerobaculia bacterium]
MAVWLKGTVPGIILLGALGSIVAYFLLQIASWLGRRLALWIVGRARAAGKQVLLFNLRPFARTLAIMLKYAGEKNQPKLVVWAMSILVAFWSEWTLFAGSLIATVVIGMYFGASRPVLLATIAGTTILLGVFLLRSVAELLAVYMVMFRRDVDQLNEALKSDSSVIFFSTFAVILDEAIAQLSKKASSAESAAASAKQEGD